MPETVTDSLGLKRSDWAWRERWRRSSFLQAYGDHTFEASDVPYKDNFYGREHGRGENHTLREFFESLPPATESPPEEAP